MRASIFVAAVALLLGSLVSPAAAVTAADKPNYNVVPMAPECAVNGGQLTVLAQADMRTYTTSAKPSKRANITNFILRVRLEPADGGAAGAWATSSKYPATTFKTPGNYTKRMSVTSNPYAAKDGWVVHMQAVFVRSAPVPDLVKDFTTTLTCPGLILEPDPADETG